MVNSIRTILVLFSLSISNAYAFTAIAFPEESGDQYYYYKGADTQKEADTYALEGCRVHARSKGNVELAKTCKVQHRQKGSGYGAVSCGENGCTFISGYSDNQEALDTAYSNCSKSFKNCNNTNMNAWFDDNFPTKKGSKPKQVISKNTHNNTVTCNNSCSNGRCVRTFADGRKEVWQAPRKFNPLTNNWEWDTNTNACGI